MFSSLVDTGQVSPASFSTSSPQIIYLLVKYSIQPFMFSLERKNRIAPAFSIREGEKKKKYEHFFGGEIFELVKWLVYRRQHLCTSQSSQQSIPLRGKDACQEQMTVSPYPATHPVLQSSHTSHLESRQSPLLYLPQGNRGSNLPGPENPLPAVTSNTVPAMATKILQPSWPLNFARVRGV